MRQVERGVQAHGLQLRPQTRPHAPHLTDRGLAQQGLARVHAECAQMTDLRVLRGVAAGFAFGVFGDVVGQFGQGFGRADTDARGDADPLGDARAQALRAQPQVAAQALEVHKTLVDAVDLLSVTQARGQTHQALAHVAIQLKVGRHRHQPRILEQVRDLKQRCAHADAQGLGLFAACNRAAVVVAQHNQRSPVQAGPKHALA